MNRHKGIGMTSQRTRERLVNRLREEGIRNIAVLDQIRSTPRHLFVDEALASRAYEDTALPIGYGQTISQPYIVARMTEALVDSGPMHKVLEIGTGSGYQTAILARFADRVYSVERIKPLMTVARDRLYDLKIRNVFLQHNDGCIGWSENAPYDAILAAAGTEEIPEALLQQLAVGGRLVLPVGRTGAQVLELVTRTAGGFERRELDRVSFVPLVGGLA